VKGHNAAGDGAESSLAIIVNINCTSTGNNKISESDKIKVYPNPTSGLIEVLVNESFENNYKIEVYNNLGVVIQTTVKQKGVVTAQIDLSGYPAGIYWIRIYFENECYQYKIIKE